MEEMRDGRGKSGETERGEKEEQRRRNRRGEEDRRKGVRGERVEGRNQVKAYFARPCTTKKFHKYTVPET